jgi:hypothetical protein
VSRGISPSHVEKPGFSRGRALLDGRALSATKLAFAARSGASASAGDAIQFGSGSSTALIVHRSRPHHGQRADFGRSRDRYRTAGVGPQETFIATLADRRVDQEAALRVGLLRLDPDVAATMRSRRRIAPWSR